MYAFILIFFNSIEFKNVSNFQLLAQKMACPRYDELLKEMYENPKDQILEINKQNAQLYMYLSEKTGKVKIC